MNRKNRAASTKQRISIAALNLLSYKKYDEIKISDICAAARVSIGTFYHYYKAKEDVFMLGANTFDTWVSQQNASRTGDSWREKIEKQIMDLFLTCESATLNGMRTQYALWLLHGKPPNTTPSYVDVIKQYLRAGSEANEFMLALGIDESAEAILHMTRGVMICWAFGDVDMGGEDIMAYGKRCTMRLIELLLLPSQ